MGPIGFHSIPPDSTLIQPSEDADSTPRKRILPEKISLLSPRKDVQCTQQSEITLERGMLIVTSVLRRKNVGMWAHISRIMRKLFTIGTHASVYENVYMIWRHVKAKRKAPTTAVPLLRESEPRTKGSNGGSAFGRLGTSIPLCVKSGSSASSF